MDKKQAEKLAIQFASKVIEYSPSSIFNDNRLNSDTKAKQLSDFISALAKQFEENLSEFDHSPKID